MNVKLLLGIPIIMVVIFILAESPEYWWVLIAIPAVFLKKQMRSIMNSSGKSVYDPSLEKMYASAPDEDEVSISVGDRDEPKL